MEVFLLKKKLNGYIIRDEQILKGNNSSSNGLTQIVTEGTRVSKNEAVFRYYSNNEEEITKQIDDLDIQIDKAISEEKNNIEYSPDIVSLETEIKKELDGMFKENELQNIREHQKKINNYIVKKSEIAGSLSPEGSYVRSLVEQRTALSNRLTRRFRDS